jgi:hypothetical protein
LRRPRRQGSGTGVAIHPIADWSVASSPRSRARAVGAPSWDGRRALARRHGSSPYAHAIPPGSLGCRRRVLRRRFPLTRSASATSGRPWAAGRRARPLIARPSERLMGVKSMSESVEPKAVESLSRRSATPTCASRPRRSTRAATCAPPMRRRCSSSSSSCAAPTRR